MNPGCFRNHTGRALHLAILIVASVFSFFSSAANAAIQEDAIPVDRADLSSIPQ
jgi:hypothetical protein